MSIDDRGRRRASPSLLGRARYRVRTVHLLASMCLIVLPLSAHAHLLNMTTVQVTVDADGEVLVDLKIDLTRAAGGSPDYYRLSRLPRPLATPETRALLERLAAAVALRLGADATTVALQLVGAEFPTATQNVFLDPMSWPMTHVVLRGRVAHEGLLSAVFLPTFHFEEPIALTLAQSSADRRMTRWLVTSQVSPPFPLTGLDSTYGPDGQASAHASAPAPAPVSLLQFVAFGYRHILPKGLDHVLFVLGLYLGARTLKSLLILVTAFTLAHSLTLGLASIGIVRLSPSIVEPLISASIAWVALENCFPWARNERYRPLLVFGFGLLHGLGFAGALSALDAPSGSFLPSLLSFNVGIELGQLTVIAGALTLTLWCRERPWYRRRVALPASVIIAVIAGIWTVQRLAG